MKYWFRLFLLIGAIVGVFAVIGALLPRSYDFSTQIRIDADRNLVFSELNRLPNWQNWSQWDPKSIEGLTVNYTGPETGEGATQSWQDVRGSGKLWFTKVAPDDSIEYEMLFANFPKLAGKFEMLEDRSGSIVVWSSQGRLPGGPFYGYFAPFFSTHMKNQYYQSLLRLKRRVESIAAKSDPKQKESKESGSSGTKSPVEKTENESPGAP